MTGMANIKKTFCVALLSCIRRVAKDKQDSFHKSFTALRGEDGKNEVDRRAQRERHRPRNRANYENEIIEYELGLIRPVLNRLVNFLPR